MLLLLVLVVGSCGGDTSSPETVATASPTTTSLIITVAPSTTPAAPETTSTRPPAPDTTPSGPEQSEQFQIWDASEIGFAVAIPAGWVVVGEIDQGTKRQVVEVAGLPDSREFLAAPMVLALNPASDSEGLFVAPIPPTAALGTLDEYEELRALDEADVRELEESVAASPAVSHVSARLAESAQGDLALVVSTTQFGLRLDVITITPRDGAAWTLVTSLPDAPASAGTVAAVFESFRVTGEPTFPEPGPDPADLVAAVAGNPQISGSLLAGFDPDSAVDPAIGTTAPTVRGTDFDDSTVSIVHGGVPKAIVFLAHWCPHCRSEVSLIQAWLDDTGGVAGVDIVTVVTAYRPERDNWPPGDWLEGESWSPEVIRDDATSSVYRAYGAGPFPYWVFLDGDGTVVLRLAGAIGASELETILETLRDGA